MILLNKNLSFKKFFKALVVLCTGLFYSASGNAPTNCGCDDTYLETDPRYEVCLEQCALQVPVTDHLWILIAGGFIFFIYCLYKNLNWQNYSSHKSF